MDSGWYQRLHMSASHSEEGNTTMAIVVGSHSHFFVAVSKGNNEKMYGVVRVAAVSLSWPVVAADVRLEHQTSEGASRSHTPREVGHRDGSSCTPSISRAPHSKLEHLSPRPEEKCGARCKLFLGAYGCMAGSSDRGLLPVSVISRPMFSALQFRRPNSSIMSKLTTLEASSSDNQT